MKLLYKYLNGNVTVSIYDNGTKIQEWDDDQNPDPKFPNSMDIKITNQCDLNCPYCHEKSVPNGKEGDIQKLIELLKDLPAGTELAFGGGNPLGYSELFTLLRACKKYKLIANMTINGKHVKDNIIFLNNLINLKLIYGLGISIDENFDFSLINKIDHTSNIVFHVIAGVNNISILDKIKQSKIHKVLILGYKEVGRGIDYHSENVELIKKEWTDNISKYLGSLQLSFDNISINQLEIRNHLPEDIWNKFYMGNEGQFSMYMDIVSSTFSVSSTSKEKFPIEGTIEDMFKKVRYISNNIADFNV